MPPPEPSAGVRTASAQTGSCPYCGGRVSPGARFCRTCGADLGAGGVGRPVAWVPSQVGRAPGIPRVGRWVVLGILVVLVGVGGLLSGRLKTVVVSFLGGPKVEQAIAAGGWHSLALTESGEVYAWGGNGFGQLGLGDTRNRLTPTQVPGLGRVKAIAVGLEHSLALTESGEVYAWGQRCGWRYPGWSSPMAARTGRAGRNATDV
jgi:hypothetical protein